MRDFARKVGILCWLIGWWAGLALPVAGQAAAQSEGAGQGAPANPVYSFNGQIAYIGPDNNLWLLDGNTGERQALTLDGAVSGVEHLAPHWSPDGTRLIFQGKRPGSETIFTYLAETGQRSLRQIDQDWGRGDLTWSPDGSRVAFSTTQNGVSTSPGRTAGIWIYDLTSTGIMLAQAPPFQGGLTDPQWSPDGSKLSFREFCDGCAGRFMTLDLARGARYDWTNANPAQWVGLNTDWAPGGDQVVFDQWTGNNAPGETSGLWVGLADGQSARAIYMPDGQVAAFPRWSPDGTLIAFSLVTIENRDGARRLRADLWVIHPDGSNPRLLYSGGGDLVRPEAWSPDGRQILFRQTGEDPETASALLVYDLALGLPYTVAETRDTWTADWSPLTGTHFRLPDERETLGEPVQASAFYPIDENVLVYTDAGQALALLNAETRQALRLTGPGTAVRFWLAPEERSIFYEDPGGGGRLLRLEPRPDGSLYTRDMRLVSRPAFLPGWITAVPHQVAAAPGEQALAYRDPDGVVWLVTGEGRQSQLAYAAGLPAWSADGRWLAYVTLDERLYLSTGGGDFIQIADRVDPDSLAWSPSQPLLAYTRNPVSDPELGEAREANVYDAANNRNLRVMEAAGIESWSPDGRLLALQRVNRVEGDAYHWSGYIVDPTTARFQSVGQFTVPGVEPAAWWSAQPYLYGPYQIAGDLSAAARLADGLLATAENGQRLLAAAWNEEHTLAQLTCYEPAGGAGPPLAQIEVRPAGSAYLPGLKGWLAGDGQWVLAQAYQGEEQRYWAGRCDGEELVELYRGGKDEQARFAFSPNNRWLAGKVRQEAKAVLRVWPLGEAGLGPAESLPAAESGAFTWFRVAAYQVAQPTATPAPNAPPPAQPETGPTPVATPVENIPLTSAPSATPTPFPGAIVVATQAPAAPSLSDWALPALLIAAVAGMLVLIGALIGALVGGKKDPAEKQREE